MSRYVNLSHAAGQSSDERMNAVWRQRAARLSIPPVPATVGQSALMVLIAVLGEERYGLALTDVAEVLPAIPITPVPGAIPVFAGVIQVHGEIRAVLDLRKLVGLEAGVTTGPGRVILLCRRGRELGLKVDRTEEVRLIAAEQVQLTEAGSPSRYIAGITTDSLMLIDAEALFAELGKETGS
jgi:chemotaxis signal transduction protein